MSQFSHGHPKPGVVFSKSAGLAGTSTGRRRGFRSPSDLLQFFGVGGRIDFGLLDFNLHLVFEAVERAVLGFGRYLRFGLRVELGVLVGLILGAVGLKPTRSALGKSPGLAV
ncbi:MAG: hypothetical protein U9Q79_01410 [Candidatus Hydrogenedentes bacterium]|nr:hypothetical protein [Candidatus Hydrogenedentota bacterium]